MGKHSDQSVIIIGGGLAGLSAGAYLAAAGVRVKLFEARPYLGGRTASWNEQGMEVESGLHRYLGFYREMPRLLKLAGLRPNDLFYWEDEVLIRLKGGLSGAFGLAPLFSPGKTLKGIFGNSAVFSFKDKLRIAAFLLQGLRDTAARPRHMDSMTIQEYAAQRRIPEKLLIRMITPLSAGLFFLPPERYSAFVFFRFFLPFLPRVLSARVGAFKGGMTEIMANPIRDFMIHHGAAIFTGYPAEKLLHASGRICGAVIRGEAHYAEKVILAASLYPAQQLIREAFGSMDWFRPMLRLETMPAVTLQLNLSERSLEKDRATFAPETHLASFSEQNHSTFPHQAGRLSIILSPPEKFLLMPKEAVLEQVCRDLDALNIPIRDKIRDYRLVIEPREFYALVPGAEALKPGLHTPVKGLLLAGDYTRQRYLATMEGAVYSGRLAAEAIIRGR